MCVCNLVCVCTGMKDLTHYGLEDLLSGLFSSFHAGERGCITANSVCKINGKKPHGRRMEIMTSFSRLILKSLCTNVFHTNDTFYCTLKTAEV